MRLACFRQKKIHSQTTAVRESWTARGNGAGAAGLRVLKKMYISSINLVFFWNKRCYTVLSFLLLERQCVILIAQNRTSFREYNIEVKSRCFEAHRLVQVQEKYKPPSKKAQKRGKPISQLPLKNLLIFQCLLLTWSISPAGPWAPCRDGPRRGPSHGRCHE